MPQKGAYEHRIFLDSADDSVVLRLQGSIRFDPILSGVDLLLSHRELTIRRKRIGTISQRLIQHPRQSRSRLR
jgi:hypothetical protein